MNFLKFKGSDLFSGKLLISLFLLLFGLKGYSQTYPINNFDKQTVPTCSGTFTDSQMGSPAGYYGNGENYIVTFCSANSTTMRFDFSSFNLESADTLFVYNGPDDSSPLLGKFTGVIPNLKLNSSGTCLTFRFISVNLFNRPGWSASISCCPPPVTTPIVPSGVTQCEGTTINYSVVSHVGSTYNWTVVNGTPSSIIGGANNLNITWNLNGSDYTGSVKVVEINGCGSKDSSELIVDVYGLPVVDFSGLTTYYCIYSPVATLTGNPAGGVFSGPGITGNTFNPAAAGAGTHNIVYTYLNPATGCTNQKIIQTTVDVPAVFNVGASAPSYCFGSSVNITLNGSQAGVNYQLRVNGVNDGPALPGTGLPLTWPNKLNGVYTVVATSAVSLCTNNMSGSQTVTENPLPVPSFLAQPGATTCSTTSVTYTTQPGQSGYVWGFTGILGTDYLITSGGTPADNSVTMRWLTSGSKQVSINYTNSNGCTATTPTSSGSTTVTVTPAAPTGSAIQNFCTETSPTVADLVAAGSGIQWYTAASGGSLLLASTPLTNSSHYFASQTINGCESLTRLDVTAMVSSIPPAPVSGAGTGAGCSQITSNWAASALATSYRLDVSTVNTFASYVAPYQDLDVGNVTSYAVTGLTAGTIYYYRIRAVNYCGTSANSATINYSTLPATPSVPGPITGLTPQCPVQPGQIYSIVLVPNATTYTWTVPAGWAITSGQGTISVTVTTGAAGQNGNITVTAGNSCGTSLARVLAVTVNQNAAVTSVTGLSPLCIGGSSNYTANGVVLGGGTGAWSSSNPAVATVNATGAVTGISAGTCNIIYTITGGCGGTVSAQQSITITPNAAIASVTGSSPLCIGGTSNYTANGVVLSGGTGAWSSSNPAVASVNATGTVTGISAGTCNIIYTITGGCGGTVSAQQPVTITPNAAVTSVTGLSPLCIGGTSNYTANGVILSGGTGAWSSSNPGVATVNATGTVTGISAGTCNIIYTITGGCGGTVSAQQPVTISPNASVASVTGLSPLCTGVLSPYTANGVVLSGGTGAWSSSNPAVATVNATGTVTGISAGTCNIIYTITGGCGGTVSAQQSVTITPNAAITSVTGSSPLCIGGTSNFTANGVVLSGGTGAWSSSNPAVASVNATGTVTGISAGTCNIIYTITGGCGGTVSAQQPVTITPNAAVTSVTGLSPLCIAGTSNYTANGVVLSGGTGAWSSSNPAVATVNATGTVTGVSAGTCNIIYTITGGCGGTVSAQQPVTIGPNASVTSVTGLSPLCIGLPSPYTANGVILSGGAGAWSSSNPAIASVSATGVVTGMSPGTCNIIYTITGGCGGTVSAQQSVTINPNARIVSMTSTSPLCIGEISLFTANGVVLSGGTGAWSSSNPAVATVNATGTVTGVSAGTCNIIYTITGGCGGTVSTQQPVTINGNAAITSVTGSSPMCIGGTTLFTANGVVLSGGTGAWSSSNPAVATVDPTGLVTGLSVGNSDIIYTITGGCGGLVVSFANIVITSVPAATISYSGSPWCSNTGFQNVTLTGTPGGTFSAAPAGLNIDPVTGRIDSGLSSAGTYTVTYTISAVGCGIVTTTTSVTVNQSPTVIITDPSPVCSPATVNLTDPAIKSGSTPGLTYTYWTDASATLAYPTPTTASSGTYYIKGDNGSGCSDIRPVNVIVNPLPTVTSTNTDLLCAGISTGAVDITASGGTGPYTYLWTGAGVIPAAEDQTGLAAGTYSVIVTDARSCSAISLSVTLTEPPLLTGSITAQSPVSVFGGNDGSVTVTGSGGTGAYEYNLDSGPYQSSGTFGTLTAGTYVVTVRDINLCTANVPVTISQPLPPLSGNIVSTTNVACFGTATGSVTVAGSGGLTPYEYSINGVTFQPSGTFGSLVSGPYTIRVRDANLNTFDLNVIITQPASALSGLISAQTDVICFGSSTGSATITGSGGTSPYRYKLGSGTYQPSGIFGTLAAGNYIVTVQDNNLCTFDVPVIITQPALALTGTIITQTNASCFGLSNGSVSVSGAGGTAPYQYSLNGGLYQISGVFTNLASAVYTLTVRDANLCTVNIPVNVTQPSVLSISASEVKDASCPGVTDGSITLSISGGTQPYSVIWADGIITTDRTNIPDGTYSVIVTDFNSCPSSLDVVVGVVGTDKCLEIPTVITPNNDGYNDRWVIKNIDLFPNAEVNVFNRWGKKVFSTKNLLAEPWDGTYNGNPLPTDSYHYILHLNDGSASRSGVISIIK